MGTPLRVLIVDDSEDDAVLLVKQLRRQGFDCACERVYTAKAMQAALEKDTWDVIISDYVLPEFSGPAALQLLQAKGLDVPFILVSGEVDEEIAVASLKAGAHDFVSKRNLARLGTAVGREMREAEGRRGKRQTEQALQESKERFRALFERTHDAIVLADVSTGRFIDVNEAFERLTGRSKAELANLTAQEVAYTDISGLLTRASQAKETEDFGEMSYVDREGRPWPVLVSVVPLGKQLVFAIVHDITELRRSQQDLQVLSRRLVEAQEAERRFVARELHDQIGQLITGLRLSLDEMERLPADGARAKLGAARALIDDLLAQVRNLSLALRPPMLDDLGLVPALLWQFERYSSQTGIRVDFKHNGLDAPLASPVTVAAYRIVQEALTNVARHAGVNVVRVAASATDSSIRLEIEDRGAGFDTGRAGRVRASTGLTGMRERAVALGGWLTVDSAPGQGSRVTAELPLNQSLPK